MAFEPKTWEDGADGGTPITATELNRLETGIAEVEAKEGPEGPRGPKGEKGNKGDKGDPGQDGADGADAENPFTEAEVAALKALVTESEA